jgi:hypothetical protein
MWMGQKIKEESSASPAFSVCGEENSKLPNGSMSLIWGKIVLSWDIPGYESSTQISTGRRDDSLAKKSNSKK